MPKGRCTYDTVVYCPLYHAAHDADLVGFTCAFGELAEGCAVQRGELDYDTAIGRLASAPIGMAIVIGLAQRQRADDAKAQRLRNMRAAGIR